LMFLLPQEIGLLKYLSDAKVPVNEYVFPTNKIAKVQSQLEKLVQQNYFLHKSAREAYRAYIQSYAQHALKHIFNVHSLELVAVCKSFGFTIPPKVHLKVSLKNKGNKIGRISQNRHGFSAENPYGTSTSSGSGVHMRAAVAGSDERQWSR